MSGQHERGFTLIELLVSASLMIIVLSATLSAFEGFTNNSNRNFKFNDQQEQVRVTLNQVIRQARNLANPTTGAGSSATPTTIAYAGSDRFVFQTTDPSKQWVSYCITSPSSPNRQQVIYQTSAQTGLTPDVVEATMASGCPASGWQKRQDVGDYVTNGASRPLFTYFTRSGKIVDDGNGPPELPVPLADTSKIVKATIAVYLDLDTARPPAETELGSTAWMRNQNQSPTSSFTAQLSGTTYSLNGAESTDPEGRTLLYDWYTGPANATAAPAGLPGCSEESPNFTSFSGWACLATTVLVTKPIPSGKTVWLRVTDPGELTDDSDFSGSACPSLSTPRTVPTDCLSVQ